MGAFKRSTWYGEGVGTGLRQGQEIEASLRDPGRKTLLPPGRRPLRRAGSLWGSKRPAAMPSVAGSIPAGTITGHGPTD